MVVQRVGPGTGGDVQTIREAQRSGSFTITVKERAGVQQGPAMLIVGVGIGILLLALFYLLPRPLQRYLSAA